MNWNNDRSMQLSKICTIVCAVALAVLCIWSPWLRIFTVQVADKKLHFNWYAVSLIVFAVPAYTVLFFLYRLLGNISRDRVFVSENVRCLRIISWCCFVAAVVFFVSGLYSNSWLVLGIAAVFGGLILRVVKNVFAAAVDLKAENDLTI